MSLCAIFMLIQAITIFYYETTVIYDIYYENINVLLMTAYDLWMNPD